jgi:intracellular septation protein A
MAEMAMAPRQETAQMAPQRAMQSTLPAILISGVLPYLLYQVLTRHGVATVPALSAGALFPVISTLVSWVRTRRADVIGIISLCFIAVSAATSLISGDATFMLVKESFFTGFFGLIFLGSLAAPRPLMFYLGRQFSTQGDPQAIAAWNARWAMPGFRASLRRMTLTWGLVLVAEALARVALVFILPMSAFLIVSQVLAYAVIGVTIRWTMAYGKRMRERGAAQAGTAV